jgi:HD-GYP domain-containing protein (c-di-GMP phosphodiesterase class II)
VRRIFLEQIKPGMTIGKTVRGTAGQILLNVGAEVKPHYTVYLKRLGINSVYVLDSRLEDVIVEDVIREDTRYEAHFQIRDAMKEADDVYKQKKTYLLNDKIMGSAKKILSELLYNKDIMINLYDIRSTNDYMFAHCVNVCVLSILTAMKLKHPLVRLESLALGTLLHDLGNVAIPKEILNKPGALTDDEYEKIKEHPLVGYKLFKNSAYFSASAGAIILQHHERKNGKGYPDGLTGERINVMSQVASLCDVYDALTSDRPYRKACLPHEAVEMLYALGNEYFDPEVIHAFFSIVSAYPVGTHVMLNNGESGLVVHNTPNYPLRPVVRVFYEGDNFAAIPSPYEVDLIQCLDLVITKVIGKEI